MEDSISTQNRPQATDTDASEIERWASIVGGGAMVLNGLKQRSLRGVLLAMAGSGLVYQGATKTSTVKQVGEAIGIDSAIRVEKTTTINRPASELYSFWRKLENLPQFMSHLESVTELDETKSHWVASAPIGQEVAWDAEIVKDEPNSLIAWTSVDDALVENSGFVRFQSAGDRGTQVKVVMEYEPPGGTLAAAFAKLFGEEPEQQIGDALSRFKQIMEAGEIATVEGQPRGA